MTSFRVDPTELDEHSGHLELAEPYRSLVEAAATLPILPGASATGGALDRMNRRLRESLQDLSTATGSIARSTRIAAERYRTVEGSIIRAPRT